MESIVTMLNIVFLADWTVENKKQFNFSQQRMINLPKFYPAALNHKDKSV